MAGAASFRDALALWRGTAYADLAFEPFLQNEISRLAELRAGAAEELMEVRLAFGEHATIVPELESMAQEEPLRERRWELLALAQYRAARQADALRTLQHARRLPGEELGIDPGVDLRRLEDDILQQSPALDGPRPVSDRRMSVDSRDSDGEILAGAPSFVGRDDELRTLVAALEAAAGGSGRAALISGEPGIGEVYLTLRDKSGR